MRLHLRTMYDTEVGDDGFKFLAAGLRLFKAKFDGPVSDVKRTSAPRSATRGNSSIYCLGGQLCV